MKARLFFATALTASTTRRRFLSSGASAVAVAALGAGCDNGSDRPRERPAAAGRSTRPDGPNVVLIIIDTLRADHAYGARAHTPNIDALAAAGTAFTNVHPEAMPTVPARNTILSGRRMFPFRDWHPHAGLPRFPGWEPIDDVDHAFTSVLRRAGYWTAYVTDNPFVGFAAPYERLRRSFDRFVRRGGQVGGRATGVSARERRHWIPPFLDDQPELRKRVIRYLANGGYDHDETKSFSARVFGSAAEALEAGARRRPFALVVDAFEPHEPWTPPRSYVDMYGDPDYHGVEPVRQLNLPVNSYLAGEDGELMLERMRALYAAEVTLTDRWLGVFLDRLHDLRLDRETVVVLVSDHGFYLGEHGVTGKIHTVLHPELTHVPLIVVDPEGRGAGRRIDYRASTPDIGPTLLARADVEAPATMDGSDLSSAMTGGAPPRRPYTYGGYSDTFYIRSDRWAMFGDTCGGGLRLYDLQSDPGERNDVASAHPAKVRELYRELRERMHGRPPCYAAGG